MIIAILNPKNKKFGAIHYGEKEKEKFEILSSDILSLDLEGVNSQTRLRGVHALQGKDNKTLNQLIIVTNDSFFVYDNKRNCKFIYKGFKIGTSRKPDDFNLYVIQNNINSYQIKDV